MLDYLSKLNARLLYLGARLLYRSEITHSDEMKQALNNQQAMSQYRSAEFDKVISGAKRFGVGFDDKVVCDLGCNDGSISQKYLTVGAAEIVGVDIDDQAICLANELYGGPNARFVQGEVNTIPVENETVDVIVSYDVFEHVAQPAAIVAEWHRVLKPGGKMLIGTWGWYHPFAPHLWAVMPVPWAHIVFSERTLLRACRLVYQSAWYVPIMYDFDEHGKRKADKYLEESICSDYLNKFFVADFQRVFRQSKLDTDFHLVPFGSRLARWTKPFLRIPWLREFFTGYLWIVCTKPATEDLAATKLSEPASLAVGL